MTPLAPISRKRACARPGCAVVFETPHRGSWPVRYCSRDCAEADKRRGAATLGMTSGPQKAKRDHIGHCLVTGKRPGQYDEGGRPVVIDAAHLWPRSLGGCEHPDCIVPLSREIHTRFDNGDFDLLPHLITHGRVAEIQHALGHANGDLIGLLARLTGDRYVPETKDPSR